MVDVGAAFFDDGRVVEIDNDDIAYYSFNGGGFFAGKSEVLPGDGVFVDGDTTAVVARFGAEKDSEGAFGHEGDSSAYFDLGFVHTESSENFISPDVCVSEMSLGVYRGARRLIPLN